MTQQHSTSLWSRKQGRQPKHSELLISLIVLLVVQSFLTTETFANRFIFNFLFLGVILSAIRSFSRSRTRMILATTLGAVAFALTLFAELQNSVALTVVIYSIYLIIFILLEASLIEDVFSSGRVNTNRIVGAVCIYFVLAIVFALGYSLLQTLRPDSFKIPLAEMNLGIQQDWLSEFIYFSNVTLTTLGYGDIVPVSKPARTFATLEAMFGQLYVAIVIARLVGLQLSEQRS